MTDGAPASSSDDQARQAKAAADQAVANARAAQVAANQAAAQYAEWSSPLARQQREAQAQQAVTQAQQATASARQAQISALIPDLSKVVAGTATVQGQQALFGSELARQALEKAVLGIAGEIGELLKDRSLSFLLTSSPDLATSDAAYGEVTAGLEELSAAAEAILPPVAKSAPATTEQRQRFVPLGPGGAVASAVPALLSALAPQRTLSSFSIGPDTTAAIALLARYLTHAGREVRIDDFRPVPRGPLQENEATLRQQRASLVQLKTEHDGQRVQFDNERSSHQAEVDNLTKTLDGLTPTDAKYAELEAKLQTAMAERDKSADATFHASQEVGVIADLLTSVDAFLTAIHTVPAGGTRSAYTLASLRQDLHASDPTVRVIYISASGGSSDQLTEARFFGFKEKFESIASVSVSYWVLEPAGGTIVAAGNCGGIARMKGSIGGTIKTGLIDASPALPGMV